MLKRLSIRIDFEPRDLWIGVFWRRPYWGYEVFICILPCLPIHLIYCDPEEIPF